MLSKIIIVTALLAVSYCDEHQQPNAHQQEEQPVQYAHYTEEPSQHLQYQTKDQEQPTHQSLEHSHQAEAAPQYQYVQVQAPEPEQILQAPVHHEPPQKFKYVLRPQHHRLVHQPQEFQIHKLQPQQLHVEPQAVHHEQPTHGSHDELVDYYAHPKYQYEYKVEDPHTGDNKYQHEVRDGDVVKGVYSMQEADGSIRTVEYQSDKIHGFTAVVKHSAPNHHVQIEQHHPSHPSHEH